MDDVRTRRAGQPRAITAGLLREWPLPGVTGGGDKHDRGTVLVIGGSRNTPGGVLLAGIAALRAGAGRLQLAATQSTAAALSIAVPEAMVLGLPETGDGSVSARVPDALLELVDQAGALAVGPGLDNIEETTELLAAVLQAARPGTGIVLDAYALGALSHRPELLKGHDRVVLTPNRTEAGHLLGRDLGEDLAAEARAIAGRFGVTVCLHGRIATGDDARTWRDETGDAGLGTSGSGDVLAGVVAGLLARGADPAQAACWATYAHATAGQRLTPRFGRVGYLARELLDEVAGTLAAI